MWHARQADGFRVWFCLERSDGGLATGLLSGDFMLTVVDPGDTDTTTAAIQESAQKPGLYTGLIPTAFLTTHGPGNYAAVMEVDGGVGGNEVIGVLSHILKVTQEDIDTLYQVVPQFSAAHMAVSYDDTNNQLDLQVWGDRSGAKVTPIAMAVDLYGPDGTLVAAVTESDATLVGDTYYVSDLSVVLQPLTTYRAEVSVTDNQGEIQYTRSIVTTA